MSGTLKSALAVVTANLKKDKEYRESWKANIAMAFKDRVAKHKNDNPGDVIEMDVHEVANDAAENFLQLLCDEIKYPEGR